VQKKALVRNMCHILFVLPFAGLVLFWLLPLEQAILSYSLILVASGILLWLLWKDFVKPVTAGIEGMIGQKANVIQNSNDTVKVFFKGEIWDAVSQEDLSVGQRVEITGVERMRLVVRPPALIN
jgi:membrane protein implicated in regulation of membrane protease activity